jgi:hypothetical protein
MKTLLFLLMIMTLAIACNHDDEVIPTTPNTSGMSIIEQTLVGKWIRDSIVEYNSAGEIYEIQYPLLGMNKSYVHGVLTNTTTYNPQTITMVFTDIASETIADYYIDTIFNSPGNWNVDPNYMGSGHNHVVSWYIRSCTVTNLVLSNTYSVPYVSDWLSYYHKQ